MGLDDLQHETGRDRGVEGVTAALEHAHAGGRSQPVGAGHDTEGAENFGAGCEFSGHEPVPGPWVTRLGRGDWAIKLPV